MEIQNTRTPFDTIPHANVNTFPPLAPYWALPITLPTRNPIFIGNSTPKITPFPNPHLSKIL